MRRSRSNLARGSVLLSARTQHRWTFEQPVAVVQASILVLATMVGLALGSSGVSPLAAQTSRTSSAIALSGRVVDRASGKALSGVLVEVHPRGRRVVTDTDGGFELRLRAGDYVVTASQIGYGEQQQVISLTAGNAEPLLFQLEPEPLVLERLDVVADRFESRRHSVPMSSRVLDRDRLLRSAGQNLADFIFVSGSVFRASCPMTSLAAFGQSCVYRRGQVIEPKVYIDDRSAFSGMSELSIYHPMEMHHVEVYGGGAMIRAYTVPYVESVARGSRRMGPFIW